MSSSEGLHTAAPVPGPPVAARAQTSAPAETSTPTDRAPVSGLSPERIAERVAVVDALDELPVREHVELYQRLHEELQSALAEIDGP